MKKILLLLLFIITCSICLSQDFGDMKKIDSMTYIIKDVQDTMIVTNQKDIKTIHKYIKNVYYTELDEKPKWINKNNWSVNIMYDNYNIVFFSDGYADINDIYYFTNNTIVEKLLSIINKIEK